MCWTAETHALTEELLEIKKGDDAGSGDGGEFARR